MRNPEDLPIKPVGPGVPGWALAIAGLIFVATVLIGVLVLNNSNDSTKTGTYTKYDIACYEGYSYLHDLGPTPLTLRGEKDPQCR